MNGNICAEKSFAFAIRIVNLVNHIKETKKEYTLTKQLLRAGTSIGANISEAQRGQSKADFVAKMTIASKEAYETEYWLRLLYHTNYLSKEEFQSIHKDILEIIRLLVAICKTASTK